MFRWGRVVGFALVLAFWGFTLFRHTDLLRQIGTDTGLTTSITQLYCKARSGGDSKLMMECLARK